jgi:hypothetical protein
MWFQVREKQLAALARFDAVEEAASQADRASYLYLRGRLLNAGPDFSAEAESLLSRCQPPPPLLFRERWYEWFFGLVTELGIQINWIRIENRISSKSVSGSRVLMTKNWKLKYSWNFLYIFSWSKIAVYLGHHKERPSYRRSLQPSKENTSTSKMKFINFFLRLWLILPSWIRIQIADPDTDTDPGTPMNPDPQHFLVAVFVWSPANSW